MTLKEFRKHVFEAVASVSASFDEPDDDWPAIFFLEDEAGRGTTVRLCGHFFDGAERKDLLAEVLLPTIIQKLGAIRVALLTSSWISVVDPDNEERVAAMDADELRPSTDPLGQEAVTIMIVSVDQIELWTARIRRSLEQPPTLAEWQKGEGPHGRFLGPLQQALQHIQDGSGNGDPPCGPRWPPGE